MIVGISHRHYIGSRRDLAGDIGTSEQGAGRRLERTHGFVNILVDNKLPVDGCLLETYCNDVISRMKWGCARIETAREWTSDVFITNDSQLARRLATMNKIAETYGRDSSVIDRILRDAALGSVAGICFERSDTIIVFAAVSDTALILRTVLHELMHQYLYHSVVSKPPSILCEALCDLWADALLLETAGVEWQFDFIRSEHFDVIRNALQRPSKATSSLLRFQKLVSNLGFSAEAEINSYSGMMHAVGGLAVCARCRDVGGSGYSALEGVTRNILDESNQRKFIGDWWESWGSPVVACASEFGIHIAPSAIAQRGDALVSYVRGGNDCISVTATFSAHSLRVFAHPD